MDKYELEAALVGVWGTSSDIELLIDQINRKTPSKKELIESLRAIMCLHNLRADRAYKIFESIHFKKSSDQLTNEDDEISD
jgi:hypothetical protein